MKAFPELETCPYFGPIVPGDNGQVEPKEDALPADYASNPFRYLPPRISLSEEELDLARRYEQGDISGGYVASQIAHFRRGITKDRYESIIDKFRLVESEIQQRHLKLPSAFIDFIYDYEKVVRIRHNTICLQIPDRLVAFPGSENLWLFLMFAGAQGSGFWYLLLSENADPIVVWCSDAIGMDEDRPASMHAYPTTLTFRKCADSFEAWIVMYFIQSAAHDRNYEAALKQFPGL